MFSLLNDRRPLLGAGSSKGNVEMHVGIFNYCKDVCMLCCSIEEVSMPVASYNARNT